MLGTPQIKWRVKKLKSFIPFYLLIKKNLFKGKVTDQDILSKPRKSPFPMIPVSKALEIIIENSDISKTEKVHFLGKTFNFFFNKIF